MRLVEQDSFFRVVRERKQREMKANDTRKQATSLLEWLYCNRCAIGAYQRKNNQEKLLLISTFFLEYLGATSVKCLILLPVASLARQIAMRSTLNFIRELLYEYNI